MRCEALARFAEGCGLGEETLEGDGMGRLHQQRSRAGQRDDLFAVDDPHE